MKQNGDENRVKILSNGDVVFTQNINIHRDCKLKKKSDGGFIGEFTLELKVEEYKTKLNFSAEFSLDRSKYQ